MVFSEQIKQNFITYSHEIIQGYDFGNFRGYFLSLKRLDSYELIKELYKLKDEDETYIIALLDLICQLKEITDLDVLLIPVESYYRQNQITRKMALSCFKYWEDKVALFFLYQLLPDSAEYVESYRVAVLYNLQQKLDITHW